MAWFGSIHVRMQSVDHVVTALRLLKLYDCYVGKSGADWIGVYDKRNEELGGTKLAELARELSLALGDAYVFGYLQGEDGFYYWLWRGGVQLDSHPPSAIKGLLFVRRGILDLCPTKNDKARVLALLEPKRVVKHVDFRMTEEELRAEIERNKRRRMAAGQRAKMTEEQRKIYPTDRYATEVITRIFGIEYFWLLYSDFSPYDLPPTFVHIDYFSK